jgi:hypothetical protein
MSETLLKNRLSLWKFLADKNRPIRSDVFIQFMIYWLIFDGYLSETSGLSSDRQKLDWFYVHKTPLRKQFENHFASPTAKPSINLFVNQGVRDMRPRSRQVKRIQDPKSLKEILEAVYQVRCNLFHGAKDRFNPDDENKTQAALELIKRPIRLWLTEN